MSNDFGSFQSLDLGSNPATSVAMDTIEVEITSKDMVDGYAVAFVKEAQRVNPARAAQVGLTEDEMKAYASYLLIKHVKNVHGECPEWRQLKSLYVPVFLQYSMSMIGEVVIRDRGIRLIPVINETEELTFNQALEISSKIGAFERELQVVQDAMPRSTMGNESVMGTAVIAGYVRSMRKVDHVADTYVAAFLGMKLAEEQAFQVLYRVQYDDIEFIRSALTHNPRIFAAC